MYFRNLLKIFVIFEDFAKFCLYALKMAKIFGKSNLVHILRHMNRPYSTTLMDLSVLSRTDEFGLKETEP